MEEKQLLHSFQMRVKCKQEIIHIAETNTLIFQYRKEEKKLFQLHFWYMKNISFQDKHLKTLFDNGYPLF